MKTVKWGIIGPGKIANKFANAVAMTENSEVIACASQTLDRAEAFKETHGLKYAYSSYEELIGNAEIDAVYIANTHNFHYASAKLCLEGHKNVLCEKPFTVNATQTRELIELATKNDVFLMEAMWTRFLPTMAWVREQVCKGEIGEIVHIESNYSFKSEFDPDARSFNKALAGGGMLDLGIYPLSFTCMLLGTNPTKIATIGTLAATGVDDQGIVSFLYEGKKTALFRQGLLYSTQNDAIVYGTKGKINIPNFVDAKGAALTHEDKSVVNFESEHENGFLFEVIEANSMILQGKKESAIMPLHETLQIMELSDNLIAEWEKQ